MKLIFKQRLFSWLDSYDIYSEAGATVYTVEGRLSWGHCLEIHGAAGRHVGTVKEEVLTFLPRFAIYLGGQQVGTIRKEFTFFRPRFTLDCNGWSVDGALMEWDYNIWDGNGGLAATVSKELLRLTDTYIIDVANPDNALMALLIVLAIDAEKCSRN